MVVNPMNITPVKRALISVSNKTGIIELAHVLHKLHIEIISTGGTSQALREAGIPHRQVDEMTGLPEMLNGRVKTLHPKVHGGILGKRDVHADEANKHQIEWIDLVVVNFYPFEDALRNQPDMSWDKMVEYIDIGGPTMVRAAAKNFAWVGVVVDPNDYSVVMTMLQNQGGLTLEKRKQLAEKVFELTSRYDAAIYSSLSGKSDVRHCETQPATIRLQLQKSLELRYGENPHQRACAYQLEQQGILSAKQHQGKPLSYNNILDSEAALACVQEFEEPTCVIVKHANPCGVASASTIEDAYQRAYNADSLAAFGGIVALNRPCTKAVAEMMSTLFVEVILAPAYTPEALSVLSAKQNLRVLELSMHDKQSWELRFIAGGALMQEKDAHVIQQADLKVVTQQAPTTEDVNAMLFAWRVLKHIKSNGILIAKDKATIGIGAGQVSRVDSVAIALRKAGEKIKDTILASDAFFPFRDSIDHIAASGIRAIIQPGGSVRDDEVIQACNEHGIAMVFTGKRCFRH